MPLEQTSHLAGSVLTLPCFPVQPFPTIAHAAGFGRLKVTSHPVKSNYGLCAHSSGTLPLDIITHTFHDIVKAARRLSLELFSGEDKKLKRSSLWVDTCWK